MNNNTSIQLRIMLFCSLIDKRGFVTSQYEEHYGIEACHERYGAIPIFEQPVSKILLSNRGLNNLWHRVGKVTIN